MNLRTVTHNQTKTIAAFEEDNRWNNEGEPLKTQLGTRLFCNTPKSCIQKVHQICLQKCPTKHTQGTVWYNLKKCGLTAHTKKHPINMTFDL